MEAACTINKLLQNPPPKVLEEFLIQTTEFLMLFFEILIFCPEKMRFRGDYNVLSQDADSYFFLVYSKIGKSYTESLAVLCLDSSHCFLHPFFKLACIHKCLFPSHQSASPHPAAVRFSRAKSLLSLN